MKPKHTYTAAAAFISANLMVASSWASPALGVYCGAMTVLLWVIAVSVRYANVPGPGLFTSYSDTPGAECSGALFVVGVCCFAFVALGRWIAYLQAAGQ